MDAQGVQVLHVANCDAVVERVADYFVLELFPSLQRLVYDHLAGMGESSLQKTCQLQNRGVI